MAKVKIKVGTNWENVLALKGDKGDRSTITIGEVTTSTDTTGSVTNSGDEHDAIFDFVLPRSAKWFSGTQMTGEGTKTVNVEGAIKGDFYLNTSTGEIYNCTAHTYSSQTWQFLNCISMKLKDAGSASQPVYVVNGEITPCTLSFSVNAEGILEITY